MHSLHVLLSTGCVSLQGCEVDCSFIVRSLLPAEEVVVQTIIRVHSCKIEMIKPTAFWILKLLNLVVGVTQFFSGVQVFAYAHESYSVALRGLDELGHPTAGTFSITQSNEVITKACVLVRELHLH